MNPPPEHSGLAAWTELCESCDWDEVDALRVLECHIQAKAPLPSGRRRELCTLLTSAYVQIKSDVEKRLPEC